MRRVILPPVQVGGLARKDLNWSTPDTRLYSEALTGRARSIPRCTYCLRDDHSSQHCPQNPDQLWGTRGQHLGKDLLPLRSAASCAGDIMKGDAGWQLADSPTPAGVLTRRSPAVRVTSGLRPPPSGHGHSTKHLIWQRSFINKRSCVEFMLA